MKNNPFHFFAIPLLAASFAFAGDKPIPILNGVVKFENDQSILITNTIATIKYRPTSSRYIVHGNLKIHDAEEKPHFEMWNIMPDGNRYFFKHAFINDYFFKHALTNDFVFYFSFDLPLPTPLPKSATLEINVVMPGKGFIEISDVSMAKPGFRNTGFRKYGNLFFCGMLGGFWGLYCALTGYVGGMLLPRGKGRKLYIGMVTFGLAMGVIQMMFGFVPLFFNPPYDVWYPPVLVGAILFFVCLGMFKMLKKFIPHPPSPIPPP